MKKQRFTVILLPQEDGGYQAHFPYYPGCLTWGSTVEEALGRASGAIAAHLKGLVEEGLDVGLELAELPYVVVSEVEIAVSEKMLRRSKEESRYLANSPEAQSEVEPAGSKNR